MVVAVKSLACELPSRLGVPLSRPYVPDIEHAVIERGIVAEISGTTIWRWLSEDAIKPWQHRSWIFPRDPKFEVKADRVLDLYAGTWKGKPLGKGDFAVSSDEKTSIQARVRYHETLPAAPGRDARVESSSTSVAGRCSTWQPGTSTEPRCSVVASPRPGSSPSVASSNR